MPNATTVKIILRIILGLALLVSFYIFCMAFFFKSQEYKHVFSAWQFPMLLAIFMEVLIVE